MVLEVGDFHVEPGTEADFIAGYHQAREFLAGAPGCQSVRMLQSVETPTRFTLLVVWDSVEAHVDGFRSSDRAPAWRAPMSPFFAKTPFVEHFNDI